MFERGLTPRDVVETMLQVIFGAIFKGNGYSQEWQVEAKKRGLPNLRTARNSGEV